MTFQWSVKSGNETEILYVGPGSGSGTSSPLTINNEKNVEYRCVANNSVGIGTECEIKINGMEYVWFFLHFFFLSLCVFPVGNENHLREKQQTS